MRRRLGKKRRRKPPLFPVRWIIAFGGGNLDDMHKKHHNFIQDDRAIMAGKQAVPPRVAARMEGVVKNAGTKNRHRSKKGE